MRVSPEGVAFIKQFEGLRLTSYQCQAGIWSVGYGTTGPDIGPNTKVTKEEAEILFASDLMEFEGGVRDSLKVTVNQNEFDALVSFAYNVGLGAFRSSTLLKLLNDRADDKIVASEFLRWVKVGNGKPSEGLKIRREKEKQLFLTKPIKAALAHSILAQRDTWLKRKPLNSSSLAAEEKLFVPKGSAHIWRTITMVPGETHYEVRLEAQPDKPWWFYPPHWKIINDPKPPIESSPVQDEFDLVLNVPYFSQRDNKRDPSRTCFSSSCAMLLKYLKPKSIKTDDDYVNTVFRKGDTTSASAQLAALEEYGIKADFKQNGGWADIDAQLALGIPVPIGILHRGPVQDPTGGGHWIIVIGRTEDNNAYIVHDPYGDLDLINGGYLSTDGDAKSYSKKNLGPRWLVESAKSGWFIKAYK
jgi:GH24 family phage-related lysozyme (muramidase)